MYEKEHKLNRFELNTVSHLVDSLDIQTYLIFLVVNLSSEKFRLFWLK
jgi:hypothetical protein